MKINQVSFRGSIQVGPYQYLQVEVGASVDDQESPAAALDHLREFVAEELVRARDGEPVPEHKRSFLDLLNEKDVQKRKLRG